MKRLRTRKQKTLRRAVFIVVVLLLLTLANAVNLLPRQAVRDIAEKQNMEDIRHIRSFYDDRIRHYRFARQYLVEDDSALMLCAVGFNPLGGWYDRDWCAAPAFDGGPLHMGYRSHQQEGRSVACIFGRLEDDDIARVVLRYQTRGEEQREWEVPQEAFFRHKNGKRYILTTPDMDMPFNVSVETPEEELNWIEGGLTAVAYDKDGRECGTEELWWNAWMSGE